MEDIAFYISMNKRFDSIVEYVKEHKETYPLEEYSDAFVKRMLKANAKEIFDEKTFDTFRRFVDALAHREHQSFTRQNIYRLCYALRIDNINSANEFLELYLGENQLSPRVLEEFIIIAGYRLNLSWNNVNEITEYAKQTIGRIPPSPRVIAYGRTLDMANDIETKVHTVEDINEYIRSELTNTYFARTRNTQYMSFFSYMDWDSYDPAQDISEFILNTWDNDSLINRHLRTFSFENEDEVECTDFAEGDHLTSKDIDTLSKIFPNAFLSYETYRQLMCRERNEQISTETMLIVLLNDISPYKDEDDFGPSTDDWRFDIYQSHDYLDFTNEEEFLKTLNHFLENSGCAHLNRNIGFDRLILDVYHDVINDNQKAIADGKCDSGKVKSLLFSRLRSVFKIIAIEYK